jgi:tRNA(fMet)-specific endonuclease VapC
VAVALDSNILWAYLGGDATLRARVEGAGQIWLPLPVLAEARFAVLNSGRPIATQTRLDEFLQVCRVRPMGEETALRYAEQRPALRRKGRPIPINDLWIAAVCLEHGLPLVSRDAHFDAVDGLQRLVW